MVDPGRLRELLDRLSQELRHLSRLAGYPAEELLADADRLAAVKYRFVVAAEICIDVGQHIIASEGLRAPASFADVFTVLGEAAFLPAELTTALEDMARFRNLLVHGYARVDDRRVVEILHTRLDDFARFIAEVARMASAECLD
ncbi:MAG TPA: DUF86 domain-containing protein [Egibacteraceae bacterium]|nr:DUF86 domain-containing protein [Egibacteraceae bacterium]